MSAEKQATRLVEEVIAGWVEAIGLSARRQFLGGVDMANLVQRFVRRLVPVFARVERAEAALRELAERCGWSLVAAFTPEHYIEQRLAVLEAERDRWREIGRTLHGPACCRYVEAHAATEEKA